MNIALSTAACRSPLTVPASSPSRPRIASIDALRGLVILLMLVDHTREFFFLHAQVSDPMDVAATSPALFATRLAAHLCAPVFVALTGLAAFLYGDAKGGPNAASAFLFKRGLFLVVLEWTVINFAWTFDLTPATVFLRVIWAIGLSMIALAALVQLPRNVLIAFGLAITLGHNLLDCDFSMATLNAGQNSLNGVSLLRYILWRSVQCETKDTAAPSSSPRPER